MGNWKHHYSSKHLDSADLDGKTVNVKILELQTEEMDGDGGEKENKMLVRFEPSPGLATLTKKRTWIAAKTCGYCLEAMFGKDDAGWIGKWVTIRSERIRTGDDAIRVVGSPDIDREVTAKVRQFGAGKLTIKLRPTQSPSAKAQQQKEPPASPPSTEQQADGDPAREPGAEG